MHYGASDAVHRHDVGYSQRGSLEITIDDAGVHDAQHAGNCVDENPRELAQQLLIAAEARAAEVRVE